MKWSIQPSIIAGCCGFGAFELQIVAACPGIRPNGIKSPVRSANGASCGPKTLGISTEFEEDEVFVSILSCIREKSAATGSNAWQSEETMEAHFLWTFNLQSRHCRPCFIRPTSKLLQILQTVGFLYCRNSKIRNLRNKFKYGQVTKSIKESYEINPKKIRKFQKFFWSLMIFEILKPIYGISKYSIDSNLKIF